MQLKILKSAFLQKSSSSNRKCKDIFTQQKLCNRPKGRVQQGSQPNKSTDNYQ